MTTTFDAPIDQAVRQDEPKEASPVHSAGGPLHAIPGRPIGFALGSLALSLAATVIARRVTARRRLLAKRRGARVTFRPRVRVFAPTMTISLPFSAINGPKPRRHTHRVRSGFPMWRPFAHREPQHQTGVRAWRQRMRLGQRPVKG